MHLALQLELNVVRIEQTSPAELILERQCFGLELDPIFSRDIRTHIHLGRKLQVGMPELENDLRVTHRKTIFI